MKQKELELLEELILRRIEYSTCNEYEEKRIENKLASLRSQLTEEEPLQKDMCGKPIHAGQTWCANPMPCRFHKEPKPKDRNIQNDLSYKECQHLRTESLDVLRSRCKECDKYFETNPYSGEVKEISKKSADFCVETTTGAYKKPKERWKPEDKFFRFLSDGTVMMNTWSDEYEPDYEFGNCFKSREEAEQARDKIKKLLHE